MVPVRRLHSGHKAGHTGPVLRNRHRDLARRAGVAITDQTAIGFLRNIPEMDPCFGKQIRNRHEGRSDNAKGMLDTVHLQHFHEGFFSGHFHGGSSPVEFLVSSPAYAALMA